MYAYTILVCGYCPDDLESFYMNMNANDTTDNTNAMIAASKILVVDDNEQNLELLVAYLESL